MSIFLYILSFQSLVIVLNYLPTATGTTAKQVCSLHFVSGLFWIGHSGVDGKAYYMSGFQGQAISILPDPELVVVRLGETNHTTIGAFDLVTDVVEAMLLAEFE